MRFPGGEGGVEWDDIEILALADEYGIDPGVIENEWSEYHLKRLLAYRQARREAARMR